jgi:hypothetical protein
LIFTTKMGTILAASPVAGIIAVVAFEAGGRGKIRRVAIEAGCSLVVDTTIFTTAVGM